MHSWSRLAFFMLIFVMLGCYFNGCYLVPTQGCSMQVGDGTLVPKRGVRCISFGTKVPSPSIL